jgi:hypothetical protein
LGAIVLVVVVVLVLDSGEFDDDDEDDALLPRSVVRPIEVRKGAVTLR